MPGTEFETETTRLQLTKTEALVFKEQLAATEKSRHPKHDLSLQARVLSKPEARYAPWMPGAGSPRFLLVCSRGPQVRGPELRESKCLAAPFYPKLDSCSGSSRSAWGQKGHSPPRGLQTWAWPPHEPRWPSTLRLCLGPPDQGQTPREHKEAQIGSLLGQTCETLQA